MDIKIIKESELRDVVEKERCSASMSDIKNAIFPEYRKYQILAQSILKTHTYPLWRTSKDKTEYIGAFEKPPTEAFPISYDELARMPSLFDDINFDPNRDYLKSTNIIVFHCSNCGISVVIDGNHRLLQCALNDCDTKFTVYEVVSHNWKRSKVDMKNFCRCISDSQLDQDAKKTTRLSAKR